MALTSTLAEMAPQVSARLQDPSNVFWSLDYEVNAGLAEGISELLLIIGRPTQIFNAPITLAANTCFQPMPAELLCITNLRSTISVLGKTTLRNLDYLCNSWSPAWQSDRGPYPKRWAPLGLSQFIVHPAPIYPTVVNVTGIAYPFTDTWPPNGSDTSVFQKEFNQAIEMYAASYARVKEIGQDFQEGLQMYQAFLEIGRQMSVIQDRRDSIVWTHPFGASTSPSQVAHR